MRQLLPDEALKRIAKNVKAQEEKRGKPNILVNLGDVNFIDYGGLLIVDTEYGPEGWYVENDMDYAGKEEYEATWTIYRFDIEKFEMVKGYLVPEFIAKSYREGKLPHALSQYEDWWMKDELGGLSESMDVTPDQMIEDLTSDDPAKRGWAYRELVGYYGPHEFDQYPLTMNYKEVHEFFGEEYDLDWDKPEEEFEEEDDGFGREGKRKSASFDEFFRAHKIKDVDQDVFCPKDRYSPVTMVAVFNDIDPSEGAYVMITGKGIDHGIQKALGVFQEAQFQDFDEGIWKDIVEELGPGANESEIEERYMQAVTENWDYVSEEYDTLGDFVAELEASEHPEAKLWLKGFECE